MKIAHPPNEETATTRDLDLAINEEDDDDGDDDEDDDDNAADVTVPPASAAAAAADDDDDDRGKKRGRRPMALAVGAMLAVIAVVVPSVVFSARDENGGKGAAGAQPSSVQYSDPIIPPSTAAAAVSAPAGGGGEGPSPRIIGGSEAVEDRHSYAVSLQSSSSYGGGGHYCGGSLIARDVVLTAAHCQGVAGAKVVLGRHDLDEIYDGGEFDVWGELPHPDYNEARTDNDFMLLFLDLGDDPDALLAGDVVATVKLNSDPSVPAADQDATVVGWGDTDASEYYSDISDVLMGVDLSVVPNDECSLAGDGGGGGGGWFSSSSYESYDGLITENMLCARAAGGDSCQGDSGGPLVIGGGGGGGSDLQIGVVSWGIGCASAEFPGVYARVSRAYDWIRGEVCLYSDYATEAGFDCPPTAPGAADPPADPPAQPTDPPISAPTEELTTSDDPCTICPNGATDSASVPYADEAGNILTCRDIIDAATALETGSNDCAYVESLELEQYCCPADTPTDENVVDELWDYLTGLFGGN